MTYVDKIADAVRTNRLAIEARARPLLDPPLRRSKGKLLRLDKRASRGRAADEVAGAKKAKGNQKARVEKMAAAEPAPEPAAAADADAAEDGVRPHEHCSSTCPRTCGCATRDP